MVTEQELLDFMRETAYKPMTYQELEQHWGTEDAEEIKSFLKLLNQLEESGQILRTRNDRYGVPERMNLVRGRVQAHAKGFAFLIPDDKTQPDIYLHANDLKSAMNGDIVLVRVTAQSQGGGRMEGEVVRVVTRAVTQVVGTFESHETYGFVLPDDKRINRDIFIAKEGFQGAVTGQKVVVRIVSYPEGRSAAEGEIVEVLGHKDDPGIDILSIIRKHQLPEGFPDEVLAESESAPDSITEEEIIQQGRRDLRDKVIVTIDGEDAKDLDDAVNVEILENGNYLLGVHIADVSYYVREKSALDQEAFRRGCSVYLVDRVIPMLPHRLSNGICSLNPQVDRLTMSCEMEFDAKTLKRVRHDVFTSVIRTKERMTYTNVRKILQDEDEEVKERYADLVDMFKLMEQLAMRLRSMRMKRGAIDFDFQESKVLVDQDGKPTDIVKRERSVAEQIIEEFMLAANETVAEHFHWLRVPFLYRIHEDPDAEKLMHFVQFASNLGYTVRGKANTVHPRALQTLLEEIKGVKEETVISTMMLRSMKQAKYDAQSLGHFGLAAEFYSHFTSPIRRYPDLVIHRVIREVLENKGSLPAVRQEALEARMPDIAQHSSERERVAVDAERDTDQLKKCEFMLDKVGEEFEGIISSVTSFGIFVELDNTVEGLIRLSDLHDDYYHFHELHMALVGERTSKVYRIGDEVKIRVSRVNMNEHTIDFEMVDAKSRSGGEFWKGKGGKGKLAPRGGKEQNGRDGKGKPGKGFRERPSAGTGTAAGAGGKRGGPAKGAGWSSNGKQDKKGAQGNDALRLAPGGPGAGERMQHAETPSGGGSGRRKRGQRGAAGADASQVQAPTNWASPEEEQQWTAAKPPRKQGSEKAQQGGDWIDAAAKALNESGKAVPAPTRRSSGGRGGDRAGGRNGRPAGPERQSDRIAEGGARGGYGGQGGAGRGSRASGRSGGRKDMWGLPITAQAQRGGEDGSGDAPRSRSGSAGAEGSDAAAKPKRKKKGTGTSMAAFVRKKSKRQ